MDSESAAAIARRLLNEHGLAGAGWVFGFDDAGARHGSCDFDRRRITLSRPLTETGSADQVTQTLLHEVAHALAGPDAGHSQAWRLKARQIGYTGGRTIPTAHSRAQRVEKPAAPQRGLRAGNPVQLPDGTPGMLRAVGRTRYHVEDGDGRWWSVPFADIGALGDEPAPAAPPAPPPALPAGARIQVTGGPAKHRGKTGVILAQGPATYRVLCDGGEERLQVPHRLAALVDAR